MEEVNEGEEGPTKTMRHDQSEVDIPPVILPAGLGRDLQGMGECRSSRTLARDSKEDVVKTAWSPGTLHSDIRWKC